MNSALRRNYFRYARGGQKHGAIGVTLAKQRYHFAPETANFAVGQNGLESIANFKPVLMIIDRQQDDGAAIAALVAHLPTLVQSRSERLRFHPVESMHGDHGDLRLSFLVDFLADSGELRHSLGVEGAGEIVYIAMELKTLDLFREGRNCEQQKEHCG